MKLKSKIEKIEESSNIIDQDLDEIEKYSLEERVEYTREVIEGVFDGSSWISKEAYKSESFGTSLADGKNGVKHFLLPGMRGSDEPMDVIRESYIEGGGEYSREFKSTSRRIFVNVGQGRMFEVDSKRKPYFSANISECSVIYAKKPGKSLCAHISMSYIDQIEGVFNYLSENDYDMENVYVVASVGEYQKKESDKHDIYPRYCEAQDYIDKGIKRKNIISFEYDMEGEKEVNVSTVLVGDGFVNKYSYDLQRVKNPYGYSMKKVGEERDNQVMEVQ